MADTSDFEEVFARLRAILSRHVPPLVVSADTATDFSLALDRPAIPEPRRYFGGVTVRRSYVSFYLMGVYGEPRLLDQMSAPLRKRMQGKSCFNFTAVDDQLFAELAGLTEQTAAVYPEYLENFLAGRR
jgi:hypothetical protein